MKSILWGITIAALAAGDAHSQAPAKSVDGAAPFDAAAAFGARQHITNVVLSPDGKTLAYEAPLKGQASVIYTLPVSGEGAPVMALSTSPNQPERIGRCNWASSRRLVCSAFTVQQSGTYGLVPVSRHFAVDAPGGGNVKLLSKPENLFTRGAAFWGGGVIDWLPEANGTVLMARPYLPDDHVGSNLGSKREGLGVDRLDTRSLKAIMVEDPKPAAVEYISDSRGNVRVMGLAAPLLAGQSTAVIRYMYRKPGSREWEKLGDYNSYARTGFNPYQIDADRNVVYGFIRDGDRRSLYTLSLDGALTSTKILDNDRVDIDELMTLGPRKRVIGGSYVTERRTAVYFDPAMRAIAESLHKALPGNPAIDIMDSTPDEQKLLILASSDNDPGAYYVFDRATRHLETIFAVRPELEGHTLASVRPITYPASDGTMIPGYLTLPPGRETAKGLPAIVMPHGGPEARDEWGFDWLAQFYAAQGYAVLQPNFRGSTGYGQAWFLKNGFKFWPIAIGDVLDAGRWLVKQGVADKDKLAVVGWSYGGYAALQSAVTDPGLFKAVVAVAPVTDLAMLKAESLGWTDHAIMTDRVGSGEEARQGSPAQNAAKIKVPVILFHGTMDINVGYPESTLMDAKLKAAGVPHELVTYQGLNHQLEDSSARADMLRRSDAFLRAAMHL